MARRARRSRGRARRVRGHGAGRSRAPRGRPRDARGRHRPRARAPAPLDRRARARACDLLVTMGCGEACPAVPGLRREDWPLEDPKGKSIERVRAIRDEVRKRVDELIAREGIRPRRVEIRAASRADLRYVCALLEAAALPIEGVDEHIATLWIAVREGEVVGAAGLEPYGDVGLLRSVVVRGDARGRGIGAALAARVEAEARRARRPAPVPPSRRPRPCSSNASASRPSIARRCPSPSAPRSSCAARARRRRWRSRSDSTRKMSAADARAIAGYEPAPCRSSRRRSQSPRRARRGASSSRARARASAIWPKSGWSTRPSRPLPPPTSRSPRRPRARRALQRRFAFGERDGLVVVERPARGAVIGVYRTARTDAARAPRPRGRRGERPYETRIDAIDPPRGSCDCPDYLRSSLGLCKHLFAVIAAIHGAPAVRRRSADDSPTPPALTWDPALALTGRLDRLEGLRLAPPGRGLARAGVAARLFRGGRLADAHVQSSSKRLAALRALARACDDGLDASPAARAIVREELERMRGAGRSRGEDARAPPRARLAQAHPLPVSARRGRALPPRRAAPARRRHGPRQDHAGDRRLSRALPRRARRARARHRARELEAAVAARVARRDRRPGRGRRRRPGGSTARLRRPLARLLDRELRAAPARRRRHPPPRAGRRGPRRGAADQELRDEVRGLREGAHAALPARAHGHADGEPARGARVAARLDRRHGARPEVAAGAVLHGAPRRRRSRHEGRAPPRHAARAPRAVHGSPPAQGRARPAARAHRHARPGRDDRDAARRARRA